MRPLTCQARFGISRERAAFTLVELLVVIAIIGVLVALLLPAIQAAREAARRVQCQNQLHNLAIAVMNYENQKKELPEGTDAPASNGKAVAIRTGGPGGLRFSWIVKILPFIEQQQLFDQFDLKLNTLTQQKNQETVSDPNRGPFSAQIDMLLCPSDSARGRFFQSLLVTGNKILGKGNYAAYVSPEHAECMPMAKGAMIHVPQPLSHISDGTSNTLMLSEVRTRDEPKDQRGAWAIGWVGSSILAVDMHATSVRICNVANPPEYVPTAIYADLALLPNQQPSIDKPRDDLYECDSAASDLEGMPCWTRGDTTASPRSLHPGGVNSARVDGSVQWLNDDISALTLATLVCINDGLTSIEN